MFARSVSIRLKTNRIAEFTLWSAKTAPEVKSRPGNAL